VAFPCSTQERDGNYMLLVRIPERKRKPGDVGVDGRIISNPIFKK
jgi:hypothetical protein